MHSTSYGDSNVAQSIYSANYLEIQYTIQIIYVGQICEVGGSCFVVYVVAKRGIFVHGCDANSFVELHQKTFTKPNQSDE